MLHKMPDGPIVNIVDDDESVCQALDSLLRSVGLQTRIYGSAREFANAAADHQAGCIILDVRLPGTSGLDFQAQLVDQGIRLPVILITGYGDIPMSVRAMKAGAVDFLSKPFRDQDILDAVNRAIEWDRKRRAEELASRAIRISFASLSPRERQVMTLVTAGKLNKQVAADLGLSEVTVKVHRSAAMRKMGTRTLADLVRIADRLKASGSLATESP
jgi:FixJ family two-component response regulator